MTYAETLAANRAKILARETALHDVRLRAQATLAALSPQQRKLFAMRQAQKRKAPKTT